MPDQNTKGDNMEGFSCPGPEKCVCAHDLVELKTWRVSVNGKLEANQKWLVATFTTALISMIGIITGLLIVIARAPN